MSNLSYVIWSICLSFVKKLSKFARITHRYRVAKLRSLMKLRIHVPSPKLVHRWPDSHTVHWLDRAFQITRRTIMNCFGTSFTRELWRADVRKNDAYDAYTLRFLLFSQLTAIVTEYARNAAAEYTISQMIRENSGWPVRFYAASANFFLLFPCATRSKRTDSVSSWRELGMDRGGVTRARNVEPSILKRSRMTVTFEDSGAVLLSRAVKDRWSQYNAKIHNERHAEFYGRYSAQTHIYVHM